MRRIPIVLVLGLFLGCGDGSDSKPSETELKNCESGWTRLDSMSVERGGASVVTLSDGYIMALGGTTDGDDALASSEFLDVESGKWRPGPDMEMARRFQSSVRLEDGKVLVVGGHIDGEWISTNTVERFDPVSESFETLAPMAESRMGASLVAISGGAMAVGGYQMEGSDQMTLNSVEIFDADNNVWSAGLSFPDDMLIEEALVVNGKVVAAFTQIIPIDTPADSYANDARIQLGILGESDWTIILPPCGKHTQGGASLSSIGSDRVLLTTHPGPHSGEGCSVEFDLTTQMFDSASLTQLSQDMDRPGSLEVDTQVRLWSGNKMQSYDPATKAWSSITTLGDEVHNPEVVWSEAHSALVSVGGWSSSSWETNIGISTTQACKLD